MNQTIDQTAFANAFAAAYKAVSSTPGGQFAHGPGALYSYPGLDRFIFNAMILPHMGLQSRLPLLVSNQTNPLFGIMTGVTATTGEQPTGPCDDFKQAGLSKLCMHTATFGRLGLDTTVVQVDDVGELTNRGEMVDLQLLGNPIQATPQGGGNIPTIPGAGSFVNNEGAKRLFELGASWSREYAHLVYNGNPTNNTSGGGYQEFYGLETLVNTGYRDAVTGIACPAADSIVHDFNNQDVSSASADIVGLIQSTFFNLRHLAALAGLGQVRWVMTMPLGMFYRLSEIWAYYYFTRALDGLTFNANFRADLDAAAITQLRDGMRGNLESRTGQFLMIDGQRVDVILDDAIPETEYTPGKFVSDIYILPLTVLGGSQQVLFMNAFNFDSAEGGRQAAIELARQFAPGDSYYTTDAGTFIWHKKPPTNWCVQLAALAKLRLILRTPYLAARIQNVLWSPVGVHERSPFTDSGYFVNGGQTSYQGHFPSFYSPTA